MAKLYRKITIPTEDVPNLGDLRYLVQHAVELGIPDRADIRLLRGSTGGPYGSSDPGIMVTWQEDAP